MSPPPIPVNDLARGIAEDRAGIDAAVRAVLDSGWLVHGSHHAAFEAAFGAYVGTAHCVGVANGTDALTVALLAVGVAPGSEVCIAGNAGFYAATACLAADATPLMVDVDATTLTMSPTSLARALERQPAAVIATHLYGGLCDTEALNALCDDAGVPLIEDCAQATGARDAAGRGAGSVGALGCFSFYPTKNLGAIGDGGAITTSSPELAERCRTIRQYGWAQRYRVESPGVNSRLDELQAAVLLHRLNRLDDRNARRRRVAAAYASALRDAESTSLVFRDDPSHVAHLAVAVDPARDDLRAFLAERGIATDVHYPIPDDRQPLWRTSRAVVASVGTPVAHRACEQVLSLPCFPELADDEVGRVADALAEYARRTDRA